jgi:hypothetical protein
MLARNFTLPVVISRMTVDGNCAAGMGTFIVVNDQGWIVTAAHILKVFEELDQQQQQTDRLRQQHSAIDNDQNLTTKERRKRHAQIGHLKPDAIDKWSVWWGLDGLAVDSSSVMAVELADIAVARLNGIKPGMFKNFPVFKEASKEFPIGVSLCRLGFPFWDMEPEWDAANNRFNITRNFPLPVFASEGILARMAEIHVLDPTGVPLPPPPFPFKTIETSSPGLLGQSGGPIFDSKGTVWGIQSSTISYELDLKTSGQQYYNVGSGVHSETVIGLLKYKQIAHLVSDY